MADRKAMKFWSFFLLALSIYGNETCVVLLNNLIGSGTLVFARNGELPCYSDLSDYLAIMKFDLISRSTPLAIGNISYQFYVVHPFRYTILKPEWKFVALESVIGVSIENVGFFPLKTRPIKPFVRHEFYAFSLISDTLETCFGDIIAVDLDKTLIVEHQVHPTILVFDPQTQAFIDHFSEKGVVVIGLTSRPYSKLVSESLQAHGIRFPPNLQSSILSLQAIYRDGIIFADGTNKGLCLASFIQKMKLSPKRIAFYDDLLLNHHQIYDAMIPFAVKIQFFFSVALDSYNARESISLAEIQSDDLVVFLLNSLSDEICIKLLNTVRFFDAYNCIGAFTGLRILPSVAAKKYHGSLEFPIGTIDPFLKRYSSKQGIAFTKVLPEVFLDDLLKFHERERLIVACSRLEFYFLSTYFSRNNVILIAL